MNMGKLRKKNCLYCNKEFETKYSKVKYCSRSCGNKHRWVKPEYQKKMSNILIERWSNNEYKEKLSIKQKKRWDSENLRKKYSKNMKKNWQDDEYRKMSTEANNERFKECNWTEENHQRASERSKKIWSDPEYRNHITKLNRERANDPKWIAKMVKIGQNFAKDVKWIDKVFKNAHKYKEYKLPSGKIVKVQGYEDKALDILLKKYDESDIVIQLRDINKEIGRIRYMFEKSEHIYYPDMYIKSENKIIEVKSEWTFKAQKEKNLAKEQGCLQQGFKFEFMIL